MGLTAYTLTLAGLLLLGGTLGDRYGRRRVFVIGVDLVRRRLGAVRARPAPAFLVVARALQGVGAALLTPGSLAILQASFVPEDRAARSGPGRAWAASPRAVGPFLGGWLIRRSPGG